MPIVNYIREHRRFIQYASDEKLTANERLLWYALMEIMNQRADGRVWPDDFIRISNDRVLTLCPMGFDTMAKARNGLKQRGLIEFRAGDKNKTNPAYRMHYFCAEDYPEKSDKDGFYPELSDNMTGNTGGNLPDNLQGNMGGNPGDSPGDQYQTSTENKNNIYTKGICEEDDEEDDGQRGCAGAEDDPIADRKERTQFVAKGFARSFGRMPYPAEAERLVVGSWRMGFSCQMVNLAMQRAASQGAKVPAEYTLTVLDRWRRAEVRQPHQIAEYELEHLIENGGGELGLGSGDPAVDWENSQEARERRRMENAEAMA